MRAWRMSGRNDMTISSPAEFIRNLRLERDRHVAFAFAGADLLIEVAPDGTILAASGAANAVLGVDVPELVGRPLPSLMAPCDQPFARQFLRQVNSHYRTDPAVVSVARADGTIARVLLGGCRLPDRAESAFLSMAILPDALAVTPQPRDDATGLLTADALRTAAQRISDERASGHPTELQLVRLDGLSGAARQLSARRAAMLMEEIGAALRAHSLGGDAAGRLSEEAFGLVARHGQNDSDALATSLADAIRESGIPNGKVGSQIAHIELALAGLNQGDAGRVLGYAMSTFVKTIGGAFEIGSLQNGLIVAVNDAANRFTETRRMLTDRNFTLVYQPVVNLTTRVVHHYEALSRFADGADTYETVLFSEDTGLVMDLDLGVCRQVVRELERGGETRVAVNLSGRSVQNADFRTSLLRTIDPLGKNAGRLLFELTESAAVDSTAEVEEFLAQLRRRGHVVCLDDFGAGAAAYNYLRRFDVDFVKIDGPFLHTATDQGRARALIRSICVLCSEIGCHVIGEMIEDEASAALATDLGIGYGQGWLFGKPLPELPTPFRPLRRRGGVETWE
jgi:EAL domain-containing protein (putative c-di-GMP-specific phosphodiesterase class I)/GGDEF domain-containing protein